MNRSEVLEKFRNINVWKSGGKRAPHKPLLILLALSQYLQGERNISFQHFESKLNDLLFEFGSILKPRSYYPFIRLASDAIWTFMDIPEYCDPRTGDIDPPKEVLILVNSMV